MSKLRTRTEQKDATRARLLSVARQAFTQHGYADTSIGMVCRRARVTHGALYHHFPGKQELFEAVLAEVLGELVTAIAAGVEGRSGWERLVAACDVYLDRCSDPTVIAVLLRDAPRALPPPRFAELDRSANEPLVVGLLEQAMGEGVLRRAPVLLLARLLGAAFAEAGTAIAESETPHDTRAAVRHLLLEWLGALRPGR
jgi:AcrR family transcriptional regulator